MPDSDRARTVTHGGLLARSSRRLRLALLGALLCARSVDAQLGPVQLPQLPPLQPVELPATVSSALGTATDRVAELSMARRLHIEQLLRANRTRLEQDPSGNVILRAQLVALSPSEQALQMAQARGFVQLRAQTLAGLDARLVVLQAPRHWSTRRALARLREWDPGGIYDFDHLYMDSGRSTPAAPLAADRLPGSTAGSAVDAPLASRVRIGLIDGGVNGTDDLFRSAPVHHHGCNDRVVSSEHGTQVASLLAGESRAFRGAAPGAELYVADVYCAEPIGATVEAVADALAWMAGMRVPVVNVSLVGPPNRMLEVLVRSLVSRGHLIVAAVGNDGPAAAPLYPASYPGVIGVTGVDARRKVLLEAGRGPQVRFAAPGADMLAAVPGNRFAPVRGTSYAAPLVAGLLAAYLQEPDKPAADAAVTLLARQAIDLGPKGSDDIYGFGLVGEALRVLPAAVARH